jgi:hypothetical protein
VHTVGGVEEQPAAVATAGKLIQITCQRPLNSAAFLFCSISGLHSRFLKTRDSPEVDEPTALMTDPAAGSII